MNKPINRIKLFYMPNKEYKITLITDSKETLFKNEDCKIMFATLKNFNCRYLGKGEYLFTNIMPILLTFYKNKLKYNKTQKNTVNRAKSKNIAISSTLAVTMSLAIGGISYTNSSKQIQNDFADTITSKIKTISSNPELETYEQKSTVPYITTENGIYKATTDIKLINENNELIEEKQNLNDEALQKLLDHYAEIEKAKREEEERKANKFHYTYYEAEDIRKMEDAKKYAETIEKYSKKFGVDKELVCAMVAQESGGDQYAHNFDKSYGLMAIERNIWENNTITVYNFETNEYETIKINYNKVIKDADYNLMIGTAILQEYFYATINSGLVPIEETLAYATQRYNMGPGNMQNLLAGIAHWMEGRDTLTVGDKRYFEKVFSYLPNGCILKMKLPNNEYISYKIVNDALELENDNITVKSR